MRVHIFDLCSCHTFKMSTPETKFLWVILYVLTHKCNAYISCVDLLVWCECDFAIDYVVSFEHWATRQVV